MPAKVSSVAFINLAQSIQFDVDPDSPVISVEKDFLETKAELKNSAPIQYANLNDVVGKAYEPRRQVAAVHPPAPTRTMLDYSQTVRMDSFANFTISGPIELKQGLALTDANRIEIHRENKGSILEYGDVDVEKGTYLMKLTNVEGHVCARLRGTRDEIIGEGCFSLDRVKGVNKSTMQGPQLSISRYQEMLAQNDRKPIPLPIPDSPAIEIPKKAQAPSQAPVAAAAMYKPQESSRTADARIIDFYDYDNPEAKPLNASYSTAVQNREDTASTGIITISVPNHPASRIVANNSTLNSRGAILPNNRSSKALNEFSREAGLIDPSATAGTVWGRTMFEGRSVAGVQVELEGRDDLKPLYLNEFYIPDVNQKSTASHGLYTFVGVPEGEYSVRATQANKFMGFQNVSVRDGTLALGDVDSTGRKRDVRLAIYDLINKTSQSAVATLQNYEEDIVVESGQSDISVQDNGDTAYALVNPLNKKYLTSQYLLNPGEDLYNFPLVSSDWVEQVLSQAKLERPVRNKLVLGIGSQKPFRVEAIGSKSAQVIYFDSEGQILDGNYGSAGGGFFILDPEDEVTEYAVQFAGEKTVRMIYMPTIPNVLNIIQL